MLKHCLKIIAATLFGISSFAHASETLTINYDARGRLIRVVHSGSVNNGVTVDYTHDTADNRTNVKTTGSSN